MNDTATQLEKIRGLLEGFSSAMLVTHLADGTFHARPMKIAEITDPCDLWFLTHVDSAKVHEIETDTHAQVLCQQDNTAYLSLAGRASIRHDRARIDEVWKEPFRVWFPDGKDDPHLALIQFTPTRAEYWDTKGSNKVSYLWQAAVAYASGETPEIREGDQHGVVQL